VSRSGWQKGVVQICSEREKVGANENLSDGENELNLRNPNGQICSFCACIQEYSSGGGVS